MGPRKKLNNAIARWHSNARPASGDLEQAYADRMEAEMQEMAIQLHRVSSFRKLFKSAENTFFLLPGVAFLCAPIFQYTKGAFTHGVPIPVRPPWLRSTSCSMYCTTPGHTGMRQMSTFSHVW